MTNPNEIARVVEIEHAGETLYVQVHVHLSQEEIERIVAPAVLKSLSRQMNRRAPYTPRVNESIISKG